MARRNPPAVLSIEDYFQYGPRELKAVQAKRLAQLKTNGRRSSRANPHRDEYLALQGYHGRVLWPRYEPGGGINSGDADYIPTMTHGALFAREINLLKNGRDSAPGRNDEKIEKLPVNVRRQMRSELFSLKEKGRTDAELREMLGLSQVAFSRLLRTKGALENGGGTYMGMRVTSARFNGTCKMSGNPYERGEEIVKVPEVGWCSLSAVQSRGAKENRGKGRGRRNRL
jgi:hypothetical protein